jgi:hypothetical protein
MSKSQVLRSRPTADEPHRPGLLGGLGKTLATGLALYRGWHS